MFSLLFVYVVVSSWVLSVPIPYDCVGVGELVLTLMVVSTFLLVSSLVLLFFDARIFSWPVFIVASCVLIVLPAIVVVLSLIFLTLKSLFFNIIYIVYLPNYKYSWGNHYK